MSRGIFWHWEGLEQVRVLGHQVRCLREAASFPSALLLHSWVAHVWRERRHFRLQELSPFHCNGPCI